MDFSKRTTTINKKVLKSIDPKRIISALLRAKRELYDRPYDPQAFIDSLRQTYGEILKKEGWAEGDSVPIQRFYFEYVMSLQSKVFFQDMDKGKFRGYSPEPVCRGSLALFSGGHGRNVR